MNTLKDRLSEYDWELLKQSLHDADSAMFIINRILEGQHYTAYGSLDDTAPAHCRIAASIIEKIRKHILNQESESDSK